MSSNGYMGHSDMKSSTRLCTNAAHIKNTCQRQEQAKDIETFICWQRSPCTLLGRRQKSLCCPTPPPDRTSQNKHHQLLIHTESWSCIQTTIHFFFFCCSTGEKTHPSIPLLTSDTSVLQHASATATHAEASLLILS